MFVRMYTKQEIPFKFFISCDFNENVADLFIHSFIHYVSIKISNLAIVFRTINFIIYLTKCGFYVGYIKEEGGEKSSQVVV